MTQPPISDTVTRKVVFVRSHDKVAITPKRAEAALIDLRYWRIYMADKDSLAGKDALEKLLARHETIISYWAKVFVPRGPHKQELVDCKGNAVLSAIKAYAAFDPDRGPVLADFVSYRIRIAMLKAEEYENLIRCPAHVTHYRLIALGQYQTFGKRRKGDVIPMSEEEVARTSRDFKSLGAFSESKWISSVVDLSVESEDQIVDRLCLQGFIDGMPKVDSGILKADCYDGDTLEKIARNFDISTFMVRQKLKAARKALRSQVG